MPNDYAKPLNKWIEEEEEYRRIENSFDINTKEFSEKEVTDKRKVRVIYERPTLDEMLCKDFEHEFIVIDSHNYIIKCKKCPLHKHIMPGEEYIDKEGHVRLRSNDVLIA
jgi:hypothetical protein